MKTMITKLFSFMGFVPRGTSVVVHELKPVEREIKWTQADAHLWHQFRETETWKKLAAMSVDSSIQSMLPRSGPYRDDPVCREAFVVGRTMQLEYLAEFAVASPDPDEDGPESEFSESY